MLWYRYCNCCCCCHRYLRLRPAALISGTTTRQRSCRTHMRSHIHSHKLAISNVCRLHLGLNATMPLMRHQQFIKTIASDRLRCMWRRWAHSHIHTATHTPNCCHKYIVVFMLHMLCAIATFRVYCYAVCFLYSRYLTSYWQRMRHHQHTTACSFRYQQKYQQRLLFILKSRPPQECSDRYFGSRLYGSKRTSV